MKKIITLIACVSLFVACNTDLIEPQSNPDQTILTRTSQKTVPVTLSYSVHSLVGGYRGHYFNIDKIEFTGGGENAKIESTWDWPNNFSIHGGDPCYYDEVAQGDVFVDYGVLFESNTINSIDIYWYSINEIDCWDYVNYDVEIHVYEKGNYDNVLATYDFWVDGIFEDVTSIDMEGIDIPDELHIIVNLTAVTEYTNINGRMTYYNQGSNSSTLTYNIRAIYFQDEYDRSDFVIYGDTYGWYTPSWTTPSVEGRKDYNFVYMQDIFGMFNSEYVSEVAIYFNTLKASNSSSMFYIVEICDYANNILGRDVSERFNPLTDNPPAVCVRLDNTELQKEYKVNIKVYD